MNRSINMQICEAQFGECTSLNTENIYTIESGHSIDIRSSTIIDIKIRVFAVFFVENYGASMYNKLSVIELQF